MTHQLNLFDIYFRYVKDTESPLIYHRWSLITGIGALLGRSYWLPFGIYRIFPNTYTMLVGNPGTRKSSAIKIVKKVLSSVGYNTFAADKTSKEKFLLDLEGDESTEKDSDLVFKNLGINKLSAETPRELFIVADEFNQFTGSGNLDFLSLLGMLWDWDDENSTYTYRLKNSKSVSIYQPTISILGGNTHEMLQDCFPSAALGQGILSRIILVHSESSGKKITFPTAPPAEIFEELQAKLFEIKNKVNGPATISKSASNALDLIYKGWKDLDDYRFKHYSTRRFTHLLKLSLIFSAARVSTTVDIEDVVFANSVLTFTEKDMSRALGEFGKSKNSEAAQIIMAALYEATSPVTLEELWRLVSRDLEKRTQLADVMSNLQQADKVIWVNTGVKQGFLSKSKPNYTNNLYVDFKLLQEAKL